MFHQRTYETFQISPSKSERARVELAEFGLGVQLPEALKEWYSVSDAVELTSRQDHLVPMEKLKIIETGGKKYVHFMSENQGVCLWATELSGQADPQVIVNVDEGGWEPYSSTFSDAIFCQMWDWAEYPIRAWADAKPPSPAELTGLMAHFFCLPVTYGWPIESCTFRLSQGNRSLLVWSHPSTCHFNLRARTANDFQALLNFVRDITDVTKRLQGNDPISKNLISELQQNL